MPKATSYSPRIRLLVIAAGAVLVALGVAYGLLARWDRASIGMTIAGLASWSILFRADDPVQRRHLARTNVPRAAWHPTIGSDGIALASGRFIPYGEVESFAVQGECVDVKVRGEDEPIVLLVAVDDVIAAERRVEEGIRRGASEREPVDATLAAELAASAVGPGYRAAAIDEARVRALAEDDDADPEARVAACGALRTRLAPEERRELVSRLAAVAHPRVRVAVDALAEDEDREEWTSAERDGTIGNR